MKNKTGIFLASLLVGSSAALVPSAHAGGVVITIGTSFRPRPPAVYATPLCAPPVVTCAPVVPAYCPPVGYVRPVAVAPYYVPPSARFGYGFGLYGRPRYCGWY